MKRQYPLASLTADHQAFVAESYIAVAPDSMVPNETRLTKGHAAEADLVE